MRHDRLRVVLPLPALHETLLGPSVLPQGAGKLEGAAATRARRDTKNLKLAKQGGRCKYCRVPLTEEEATAEHRKPIARGGLDVPGNLDAACQPCNAAKGKLTKAEFERAIYKPSFGRDPAGLYDACMLIRLRIATERSCSRLRKFH